MIFFLKKNLNLFVSVVENKELHASKERILGFHFTSSFTPLTRISTLTISSILFSF